jgi:hypothetical protein
MTVRVKADANQGGKIQDLGQWVDLSAYRGTIAQVEPHRVSNCALVVEGCDVQGGAFYAHATFTTGATEASQIVLLDSAPYGSPNKLGALMRWKIVPNDTNPWEACFRITLVAK